MIVDALEILLRSVSRVATLTTSRKLKCLAAQVEPEALLADKGYDADSFIKSLEVRAIKAVIPPKSNRKAKRDLDLRSMPNATSSKILQYHQAFSRHRNTIRKDRPQLPRRSALGLRARLAQMTTGPSCGFGFDVPMSSHGDCDRNVKSTTLIRDLDLNFLGFFDPATDRLGGGRRADQFAFPIGLGQRAREVFGIAILEFPNGVHACGFE